MEIFNEICALFNVDSPKGYPKDSVKRAKERMGGMPRLLEQFYLQCACSDELQHLQDFVILPDKYPVFYDYDYLVFFNENQGVCQAGIHKNDLEMHAPPVYTGYDNEWFCASDTLSEFLTAMFDYQASICLEYSPLEFYWITEQEKQKIESLFTKRKGLKSWFNYEVLLYAAGENARISLIPMGDDIQMIYAANNKKDFDALAAALAGIGEAM